MPDGNAPAPTPVQRVHLELLARLIDPKAMAARDAGGRITAQVQHQVGKAFATAEAVQAAVALQLALSGDAPDPPGRMLAGAAVRIQSATERLAEAAQAVRDMERLASADGGRAVRLAPVLEAALAGVQACRPKHPRKEHRAAWDAVQAALEEARNG
jgi:hypothetical protein